MFTTMMAHQGEIGRLPFSNLEVQVERPSTTRGAGAGGRATAHAQRQGLDRAPPKQPAKAQLLVGPRTGVRD